MQAVFASIRKVAATNAPVLLVGESGTGKEMAAAAIHRRSVRKGGPFVAINCNAIPENLLGVSCSAMKRRLYWCVQRKGCWRHRVAAAIQVKLLRFLQEQRLQWGKTRDTSRYQAVAATNADLKQLINSGKFREDLYFRPAVITIRLLPLRERGKILCSWHASSCKDVRVKRPK
jgi:two-component system NtrC family response regulator